MTDDLVFLLDGTDHDDNTCIGLIMSELIPRERAVGVFWGNGEGIPKLIQRRQDPGKITNKVHHLSKNTNIIARNIAKLRVST